MSVKDRVTSLDLGRGGCSELMGEHAFAHVCSPVQAWTHVAAPLLGTSAPKPSAAGKEEGAAQAWWFHCTDAKQLKFGVLQEAWSEARVT